MIQMRFLGKTRLTDASGQQIQMATRKIEQVLAYLWLKRDQPQPRERMAGIFWPDGTDEKARASLRNAFFEINKKLSPSDQQPLILSARNTAQFNRAVPCYVDVEEFEIKLKESEDQPHQKALQILGEAVSLYQGDFLSESYDDWSLEERDYLQERYLTALKQLVAVHKEQENFQQAIQYAKLLLAKNTLQEETHRDLMLLYYSLGDRSAALQAFQDLTKLLDAELGIEPLPETQALYKLILERASTSALEEKSKQWKELVQKFPELGAPFIGRVEETGQILAAWEEARQGHGKAILVAGEAGSGKTRLAQEILNYVRAQGGLVLMGQCYESEGPLPYQPWMEMLRELIAKTPQKTQQQFQPFWLSELGKLLPEISELFPDMKPRGSALPLAQEKSNLFEAIAQVLLFVSEQTPLALHLDDLQWADQATLQLLHYLARRMREAKIFILGSHRSEYVVEGNPLKDFINTSLKEGIFEQLTLPLFSRTQIAELVQGIMHTDEDMPPEFIDRLEKSSHGNAFFVVELMQSYVRSRTVYMDDSEGWRVAVEKLADAVPPRKVEAVVEDRLRPISSESRELLNLVSTRSRSFMMDFLGRALNRSDEHLLKELDELVLAGLLSEHEATYQFKHDVIRDVVYHNLLPERKRRLHLLTGQVLTRFLESKVAGYGTDVIGEIANHYYLAKDEPIALEYSLRAGEYAWGKHYSKEEAVLFFQRALTLAEKVSDERGLSRAYKGLGEICAITNMQAVGLEYCLKALDLSKNAEDRAEIYGYIASVHHNKREMEMGLEHCNKGLSELGEKKSLITAKLLQQAGSFLNWMRRFDEAVEYCQKALPILETHPDSSLLSQTLSILGQAYSGKGEFDAAIRYLTQATENAEELDDRYAIGLAYFQLGIAHKETAGFHAAIRCLKLSLLHMEKLSGQYAALHSIQSHLIQCYVKIGSLSDAMDSAHKQLDASILAGNEKMIAESHGMLGCLLDAHGAADDAEHHFNLALALASGKDLLFANVIHLYLYLNKIDKALDWFVQGFHFLKDRDIEHLRSGAAYTQSYIQLRNHPKFIAMVKRRNELSSSSSAKGAG